MAPQHVLLTLPSKEWQADAARIYQITPAHTSTKAASRKKLDYATLLIISA